MVDGSGIGDEATDPNATAAAPTFRCHTKKSVPSESPSLSASPADEELPMEPRQIVRSAPLTEPSSLKSPGMILEIGVNRTCPLLGCDWPNDKYWKAMSLANVGL